jgi:hypothetical protein
MGAREPMRCTADDRDDKGVGRCPCSLVTATGGTCGVFGPPPTFAEAFPYLTPAPRAALTTDPSEGESRGE